MSEKIVILEPGDHEYCIDGWFKVEQRVELIEIMGASWVHCNCGCEDEDEDDE